MMRKPFLLLLCIGLGAGLSAQTLFTYGPYAVSAPEFLRAFSKNNVQPVTNKGKAMREYLDLYVRSRLKVREAYDRRLDTLSSIRNEVENLRAQISENFMTDPDLVKKMTGEAFARSQKDVKVAHIFIAFRNINGQVDTTAAAAKKDQVLARLKKEDFGLVAQQLSDDTTARTNKGLIGYVTVFTLPYALENALYATKPGNISAVVRSAAGYHILKNLGERKAVGKIKAQQILIAYPSDADAATRARAAKLADSLYKRILAGDNFSRLATQFSNDYLTAAAGGNMNEAGVGQFEPAFENQLFGLARDGAVSKPFQTSHGWHILKRISTTPVVTNPYDKNYERDLQQKIRTDARWKSSSDFIYRQVQSKKTVKRPPYQDEALWAMSDSVLNLQPMRPIGRSIQSGTPVYVIGDSVYDAQDWINYANAYRYKQDGSGPKPWPQVRDEFEQYLQVNYYRDHLEEFNEEFRLQMQDFRDGNLFFEIMQQEIWNKAQADSAALVALYEKNKKQYLWKQSATAILFFCADSNTAVSVYDRVKKNPAAWRSVAEGFQEKLVVDSSRYEWDQLPNLNKKTPVAGMLTAPQVNPNDNSASFAYIVQSYPQPAQRSFIEAKGMVINDYQVILEQQWDERLKKLYPVKVEEKVLAEIIK